jgi:hypothetical protein
MIKKATPLIEYFSESTVACLVTMVQGNLMAMTVSHLLIASQTGIIAGAIATAGLFITKTRNRWVISAVLGVSTGVVDYYVHPGMFGSAATEAIVTGIAAAVLSFLAGIALRYFQAKRISASQGEPDSQP